MPYRILLAPDASLGVVELSGVVRTADIAEAMRALYLHPRWVPGAAVLWDVRHVASIGLSPEDLAEMGRTFGEVATAREGGRTAIVVREGDEPRWALFPRLGPETGRSLAIVHGLEEALVFLEREALPTEAAVIASS